MPRSCMTCEHPDHAAIDQALVGGETCLSVARRFALSADSVERHKRGHLPRALVTASAAEEAFRGDTLLSAVQAHQARVEALATAAEKVLRRAERRRDHKTSLDAIRTATIALKEARGLAELTLHAYEVSTTMMSREEGQALVNVVLEAVQRVVPDRETRAAIAAEIQRTLRRPLPA